MIDGNKLKGVIRGAGLSQSETARKIGISPQSLNAKINGKAEFNSKEIIAFRKLFHLDGQIENIFFTKMIDQ